MAVPFGGLLDRIGAFPLVIGVTFVMCMLNVMLLVSQNPISIAVNVVVGAFGFEVMSLAGLPLLMSFLIDHTHLTRDLAFFMSTPAAAASLFVTPVTSLLPRTGSTDKIMIGGRHQYVMEGYWIVISIFAGCYFVTIVLYIVAAQMARQMRTLKQELL